MDKKEALIINIKVPFCAGNCIFCDERSYGENIGTATRYRVALEKEIASAAEDLEDFRLEAVHICGGKLSVLGYGSLENFIDIIKAKLPCSENTPWIIDLLPDEMNDMIFAIMKLRGIEHIRCGFMGMTKQELRALHRPYSMNLVENALERIKAEKQLHFSAELVIGIPEQSPDELREHLKTLLEAEPDEIRLRRFHDRTKDSRQQRSYAELTDWHSFIRAADELLIPAGMERVGAELVYARPGKAFPDTGCEASAVMGFGLGAETSIDGLHYRNTDDMKLYFEYSDCPEKIAIIE